MIGKKKGISLKRYGDEYRLTVYPLHSGNIIPSEIGALWDEEELPWPTDEVEVPEDDFQEEEGERVKASNNISRAKSKVFDLASCNPWQWFCTFTIDKVKYDRYNLKRYYKDFSKWIDNYQRRHGFVFSYIFVPEMHEDGAWHIHGLLSGLPDKCLSDFVAGVHPYDLVKGGYRDWPDYKARFGFCSLGRVRDNKRVSAYILKYIGKGFAERSSELGARLYYRSNGLQEPEVIEKGTIPEFITRGVPFSYQNDFVKVAWLTETDLTDDYSISRVLDSIKAEE